MKSINIKLDTIDKVKEFVNKINTFDGDFDLVSARYVIDAKSIMGIFLISALHYALIFTMMLNMKL